MSFACPRTRLANEQPGLVVLCSSLREGKGSRARGMLVVRIFSGTQCVGTAAASSLLCSAICWRQASKHCTPRTV